jgi:hypothetical protein
MTLVTWTPRSNSQRSALARFETWEMAPGNGSATFGGEVCVMIRPVGFPGESRWVAVRDVKPVEAVS